MHAIEAHHGDVEPSTVEAVLVQAADAISAGRPGARRETLESYIKRLEKLEAVANAHKGVEKTYAMQAGREIRVMVKPEQISRRRLRSCSRATSPSRSRTSSSTRARSRSWSFARAAPSTSPSSDDRARRCLSQRDRPPLRGGLSLSRLEALPYRSRSAR